MPKNKNSSKNDSFQNNSTRNYPKLDKIDIKLIKALSENSRTAITTLAKICLISKQSCHYRIKRLEKDGIITGYSARINSSLLGYTTYTIYMKLLNLTKDTELKLIEEIKKEQAIRWIASSTGKWDIMLACATRSMEEFHDVLKKLLKKIGPHLHSYDTAIILSTSELWMKERQTLPKELIEMSKGEIIKIDEKDKIILDLLSTNARVEASEIAKKAKISGETIRYRIRNLVDKGLIHSFNLRLNKDAFGLTWYQTQFILNETDDYDEKKIIAALKSIEGVAYFVRMVGKWNFEINMYCKSVEEFRDDLFLIRDILGNSIREYDTNIILKKHFSKTMMN